MLGSYYTPPEAAALLRVSVKTLRNWRHLKIGPEAHIHAGPPRRVLYLKSALEAFLSAGQPASK